MKSKSPMGARRLCQEDDKAGNGPRHNGSGWTGREGRTGRDGTGRNGPRSIPKKILIGHPGTDRPTRVTFDPTVTSDMAVRMEKSSQ